MSVMELIGTVAFAISGAIVAIKKGLDYFGIVFLAIITAVGGGIIRDTIINVDLPVALANPIYVIVSIISAAFTILFYKHILLQKRALVFFDAVGLAAFAAIGAEVALKNGFEMPFVIIVFALLTGTGGGTLRDVFAREIPFIFVKEIYAVAAIAGGIAYIIALRFVPSIVAMYICFGVTLLLRLIAIKKNIHLKKVYIEHSMHEEG
jgi:uncharacterized membrane protein YeiH